MYSILPEYLLEISTNIKRKKNVIEFDIVCPCSCNTFQILINEPTDIEQKNISRWEELLNVYDGGGYSDKSGNIYLVKKGFFGIKSKKIKINREDIPDFANIVKIECLNCKKEYILFDSRQHGFDSTVEDSIVHHEECTFRIKENNATNIGAKIINDLIFEGNIHTKQYSNSFSYIEIYKIDGRNKRIIFSAETR